MSDGKDFCRACEQFTRAMAKGADWKNAYFGAAYRTRLREAIKDAEAAIADMKRVLGDAA